MSQAPTHPAPPTRPIRFVHRGAVVSIDGLPATRTALQWLREDARCTGTKEGCNEGDCGACTVIVAELADRAQAIGTHSARAAVVDGLLLRPLNACLLFLPALDGKALITVDDLRTLCGGGLHPAQQALVDCHGSQCGFCTPGFVMSLTACFEQHRPGTTDPPDRAALADVLAGNLCRCTGYRPILDAGSHMFTLGRETGAHLQLSGIQAALQALDADPPLRYDGPAPDGSAARQMAHAPRTVQAMAQALVAETTARLVGGATDIALWTNKQQRVLPSLIFTGACPELRRVEVRDDGLWIGAAVSLEDAWSALSRQWPSLNEAWRRFASPPVRHAGTLGGNIANGSPIGDGAPVLMALDADLVLHRGDVQRRVPLGEFYVDYMQSRLAQGEFIEAIHVPAPPRVPGELRAWKISKRFDSDISAVFAAFRLHVGDGVVQDLRLVFGGLAATTRRAPQAEAAMRGQAWSEATLVAAQQALTLDFQPLTDLRASASYRLRVAQNLLRRLWLETRPAQALPTSATRVGYAPAHTGAQAPP